MALDKKAIEILAVNAVKNSIVTSEYLDQFIAENDKEPSWDGFIYIYGDKSKKKSNLKGRMPVQVKGTECEEHTKSKISFSMSTVDLRNYLYDGGCILFVVYIGNNGLTNKIYYAELTPIKLRQLLTEAKEQGTKTVSLKEFPNDNNKKATIFELFTELSKAGQLHRRQITYLRRIRSAGAFGEFGYSYFRCWN